MENEWYLWAYETKTHLHNKVLSVKAFHGADGDHDHCEICWNTFSKHSCDLQEGYYEPQSKSWICPNCYNAFAALFGWTVE